MRSSSFVAAVFVAACGRPAEIPGPETLAHRLVGSIHVPQACGSSPCYYPLGTSLAFFEAAPSSLPSFCVRTTLGGCEVTECQVQGAPPSPVARESASAGVITISGQNAGTVEMEPKSGVYLPGANFPRAWRPGDALSISASGEEVPAFAGTLVAPDELELRAPRSMPSTTGIGLDFGVLSRSSDLPVEWTGGAWTEAELVLSHAAEKRSVVIRCELISSPTIVPVAALSRLGAHTQTRLSFHPRTRTVVRAGAWDVTIAAHSNGTLGGFTTGD